MTGTIVVYTLLFNYRLLWGDSIFYGNKIIRVSVSSSKRFVISFSYYNVLSTKIVGMYRRIHTQIESEDFNLGAIFDFTVISLSTWCENESKDDPSC